MRISERNSHIKVIRILQISTGRIPQTTVGRSKAEKRRYEHGEVVLVTAHLFSRSYFTDCFTEYEQRTLYGTLVVTLVMLLRLINCRFITIIVIMIIIIYY